MEQAEVQKQIEDAPQPYAEWAKTCSWVARWDPIMPIRRLPLCVRWMAPLPNGAAYRFGNKAVPTWDSSWWPVLLIAFVVLAVARVETKIEAEAKREGSR